MKTLLNYVQGLLKPRIGSISLILSLFGIFTTLIVIYLEHSTFLNWLIAIFNYADLNFFNFRFLRIRADHISGGITYTTNFLAVTINVIFMLGSLFYLYSKGIEKRLLQFIYAVIYISSWITIFIFIIFQIKNSGFLNWFSFVNIFFKILFLALSYSMLKILESNSELIVLEKKQFYDYPEFLHKKATRFQRLIHLLLDTILSISLFVGVIAVIPNQWLNSLSDIFGEQFSATILLTIGSIIYYIFFESLFRKTPAKYLTQTSVVSLSGEALKFEDIFTRTFSRKIPFNPLSFFGTMGWHDSISKTMVVQEKEQSKYGKWHWLIIPALGLVFFLNYQFNEFRNDYFRYQEENGIIAGEYEVLKKALNNLKVGDIISLKKSGNYYYDASHFLKVLKINNDAVTLAVIEKTYDQKNLYDIDLYHDFGDKAFKEIVLNKKDLEQAMCSEYAFFDGYNGCGFEFVKGEANMRIYSIDDPYAPSIKFKSFFKNNDAITTIKLENFGVTATLVNIETIEGDFNIDARLPQTNGSLYRDFKIGIEYKGETRNMKLKLIFQSEQDSSVYYNYILESDGEFVYNITKTN